MNNIKLIIKSLTLCLFIGCLGGHHADALAFSAENNESNQVLIAQNKPQDSDPKDNLIFIILLSTLLAASSFSIAQNFILFRKLSNSKKKVKDLGQDLLGQDLKDELNPHTKDGFDFAIHNANSLENTVEKVVNILKQSSSPSTGNITEKEWQTLLGTWKEKFTEEQKNSFHNLEDKLTKFTEEQKNSFHNLEDKLTKFTEEQQNSFITDTPLPDHLVSTYNKNSQEFTRQFKEKAKRIEPTEGSIGKQRGKQKEAIVFKENRTSGNYWVISEGEQEKKIDWLFPKPDTDVQHTGIKEIAVLIFDYKEKETIITEPISTDKKFTLIKPARVTLEKSNGDEEWHLVAKGELKLNIET